VPFKRHGFYLLISLMCQALSEINENILCKSADNKCLKQILRHQDRHPTGAFQCLFKPDCSAAWQFNSTMCIKPRNFKAAYSRNSDNVSTSDQVISDLSNEINILIDPPQPDVRIQDNHFGKFQSFSEAVSKMLPIIRIFPAMSRCGKRRELFFCYGLSMIRKTTSTCLLGGNFGNPFRLPL